MGQKEVDASFIQYCKDHNFSARKVAIFMKRQGYCEDDILYVYRHLYKGKNIIRPQKKAVVRRVTQDYVYHQSQEHKNMLQMIKRNQYYLTLFAFMLLGFFFSTFYILTAFMHSIFGVLIIFSIGYLCGILLYNVMRALNVSAHRHFLASMLAPFCGLAFIAAAGFYFSAFRSIIVDLFNTLGPAVSQMDIVIAVLVPLNPIVAMILFYVSFNFHTFYRLYEKVSVRAYTEYLLAIPIFLFALFVGWGIYHMFLKKLLFTAIFG